MHSLAKTLSAEENMATSEVEGPLPTTDITITCYENSVPNFVEEELDQLYQNLNSSLSHFAVKKKASGASTYIARKDGHAIAILLFKREKQRIDVINEMIDIPGEELQRFSAYIFEKYASVSIISFSLIGKQLGQLSFPYQQHDGSEDIVLTLTGTPETYLESLSPKTRRNIRRYLRAIERDYPTFRCATTIGAEINEQHLHDLIHLKKMNIGAKNLKFGLVEEELEWIVRQAKLTGLVTVTLINEKVCGGSINLRVHDNFFGQIIAYDPIYQQYGLGFLSTYLTICAQMVRGGKESHLCWGRYQYKYKLAGKLRDRASLDIYRSRVAYCRYAGPILIKAVKTRIKESKRRLLDMEHEEGAIARAGATVVRVLRKIKRYRTPA